MIITALSLVLHRTHESEDACMREIVNGCAVVLPSAYTDFASNIAELLKRTTRPSRTPVFAALCGIDARRYGCLDENVSPRSCVSPTPRIALACHDSHADRHRELVMPTPSRIDTHRRERRSRVDSAEPRSSRNDGSTLSFRIQSDRGVVWSMPMKVSQAF